MFVSYIEFRKKIILNREDENGEMKSAVFCCRFRHATKRRYSRMTSSMSVEEPEYEKVSFDLIIILIMTSFMTSSTSSSFPVGLLLLAHLYRQYGVSAVLVLHIHLTCLQLGSFYLLILLIGNISQIGKFAWESPNINIIRSETDVCVQ